MGASTRANVFSTPRVSARRATSTTTSKLKEKRERSRTRQVYVEVYQLTEYISIIQHRIEKESGK